MRAGLEGNNEKSDRHSGTFTQEIDELMETAEDIIAILPNTVKAMGKSWLLVF